MCVRALVLVPLFLHVFFPPFSKWSGGFGLGGKEEESNQINVVLVLRTKERVLYYRRTRCGIRPVGGDELYTELKRWGNHKSRSRLLTDHHRWRRPTLTNTPYIITSNRRWLQALSKLVRRKKKSLSALKRIAWKIPSRLIIDRLCLSIISYIYGGLNRRYKRIYSLDALLHVLLHSSV